MKRRSRRTQQLTITLFSFQDVMMTVMGILILLTLLMSLELTMAVAETALPSPPQTAIAPPLQSLRQHLADLRRRHEQTQQRVTRLAEIHGSVHQELESLKQQIQQRQETIQSLQEQIEDMKQKLPAKIAAAKQIEADLAEAQRLEQHSVQLRQRLQNQRQNPHLSYILQAGRAKQPILCVVSDRRIGFGAVDAGAPAIWLTHDTLSDQLVALKELLRRCDSHSHFVVILLKPSAFGDRYANVRTTVETAGFEVGVDLIKRDDHILPEE